LDDWPIDRSLHRLAGRFSTEPTSRRRNEPIHHQGNSTVLLFVPWIISTFGRGGGGG
jgi:hypothetical protein